MARRPQNQTRRRRVPLFRFAPGCTAALRGVWNDRIKLEFPEVWINVGIGSSLAQHLRGLYGRGSISSLGNRELQTYATFNLHRDIQLLSAQFQLRRVRDYGGGGGLWKMRVTMDINPTRMLAHCDGRMDVLEAWTPETFWRSVDRTRNVISSETLDGNDNFFRDDRVREPVNVDRSLLIRLTIQKALKFIEYVLAPEDTTARVGASGVEDDVDGDNWFTQNYTQHEGIIFFFNWHQWNIKQLEAYWEYGVLDAVSSIESITRRASEIAEGLQQTIYDQIDDEEDETDPGDGDTEVGYPIIDRPRNAVSLVIPIGPKKTRLILYAKSMRRVRCEVRYLANPRSIYPRDEGVNNCTTDRLENLYAIIPEINRRACMRVNKFLGQLWDGNNSPEPTLDRLSELLSQIAEVCHEAGIPVNSILSPLVANGRLYRDGSPEFLSAITELHRRRVLRKTSVRLRGTGREYAIAIRFAEELERMRNQIS